MMRTALPKPDIRDPVQLLATGFGSGLAPRAPGTAGTLLAVLPAWAMLGLPLSVQVAIIVVAFAAGIWICGASAKRLQTHDHPGIVFDEIVAFIALTPVMPEHPLWLVPAFFLFRAFDIFKPWPIRDLDHRLAGGLGIMLDDLMAAVYTAVSLEALRFLISLAAK